MLIQLMLTLMLMVIDNNWINIVMPLTSHAKLDDQDRWLAPPTASLHWPSTKGLSLNPNKITIIILLSGGWYRDVLHFSAPKGDVPSTDSFARRATSKVSVIQACHLPRPSTSYKPEPRSSTASTWSSSMSASCIPVVWSAATSTFTSTFTHISICTASSI